MSRLDPTKVDSDSQKKTTDNCESGVGRKLFTCPQPGCERQFSKRFLLKTHMGVHTECKPWICLECRKSFALKSRLKRHAKTHQGYTCAEKDCNRNFSKWSELRKHTAKEHPEIHKCQECDKEFKKRSLLKNHEKMHEKSDLCPVENCGMRVSKWRLSIHMKNCHNQATNEVPKRIVTPNISSVAERRHKCKKCEKEFLKPAHLIRHKKEVHEGVKSKIQKRFYCPIGECCRKFQNKAKLESHVNWHKGERPFLCSEKNCDRKFCGREALAKHFRKSHGKSLALVIEELKIKSDFEGLEKIWKRRD